MRKTILLGVTSGIAAYKTVELIQMLKKKDIEIQTIMTDAAKNMISPLVIEKETGHKPYNSLFDKTFSPEKILRTRKVDHIDLADNADLLLIAPATANCIAKLAYGIADDFLTTTALAMTKPIIICPSMNTNMYSNPVVQGNISLLKKRGFIVIEPDNGPLACGYDGKGRLAKKEEIQHVVSQILSKSTILKGKTVVVTAGGTRENIDQVRFIFNKSSGKMGSALADACFLFGAKVILLRAKNSKEGRFLYKQETFTTASELQTLLKKYISSADICIHTAAVADFQPLEKHDGKIPSEESLTITLIPTPKIVSMIKKWNPNVFLIACKAVYGLSEKEMIEKAKKLLEKSGAEVVLANDVSTKDKGFESETNEMFIVSSKKDVVKIPLAQKEEVAKQIISLIFQTNT